MAKTVIFILTFMCILSCPETVSAGQGQDVAGYKVDISDVIQVAVLQPDKLDLTLTVGPDGTVTFPYIGQVAVRGLTPLEIQRKIEHSLMDYMNYPLVSVALKEANSRNFYIYGEVLKSGAYLLKENTTVLQAVAMAGGFTRAASTSDIKVVRQKPDAGGSQSLKVNLSLIQNEGPSSDIKVEPGDVITVFRSRDFYIYGEVTKPGSYPLEENVTVLQAVAIAGGFTPVASMGNIKVMRQNPDGSGNQVFSMNLNVLGGKNQDSEFKVEPGDVITVSQRFF